MQRTVCSYKQILQGKFFSLLSRRCIFNLAGLSCLHSSRCGLTLMLSTNLVVWMAAVTEESIHQTEIPELNVNISHKMYRGNTAKFVFTSDQINSCF